MSEKPIILSLGAGVQSSTLAMMAACGEVTPAPIAAIFADTGAEPKAVYQWLDWLEKQLPFPVYRVSKSNLEVDALRAAADKTRNPGVPYFCPSPKDGRASLLWRQCTRDYKISPIKRMIRSLLPRKSIVQWIGISTDEVTRIKPSRVKYITHVYPLIDRGMSRKDCVDWMRNHGHPLPPRSRG